MINIFNNKYRFKTKYRIVEKNGYFIPQARYFWWGWLGFQEKWSHLNWLEHTTQAVIFRTKEEAENYLEKVITPTIIIYDFKITKSK